MSRENSHRANFLKMYLFLVSLGLYCCTQAFSSCGKRRLLFVAVQGVLIAVASLFQSSGWRAQRLSSCGARASSLHGMWDFPGPGTESVSPVLQGEPLTTGPPRKSWNQLLMEMPSVQMPRPGGWGEDKLGDWD